MGGDHGPHVTVPAALEFQARVADVDIVLVGVRDAIEAELAARGAGAGARVRVHAADWIIDYGSGAPAWIQAPSMSRSGWVMPVALPRGMFRVTTACW